MGRDISLAASAACLSVWTLEADIFALIALHIAGSFIRSFIHAFIRGLHSFGRPFIHALPLACVASSLPAAASTWQPKNVAASH